MERSRQRRTSSELPPDRVGNGQPLETGVRDLLEPRFNHDFGQVRVYADTHAHDLAQSLEARAFTHGQDMFFSAGAYRPETPSGLGLIAHELTHTIQQGNPSSAATARIAGPQESSELEASAVAAQIMAGGTAQLSSAQLSSVRVSSAPVSEGIIARQPASEPESEASKAALVAGNLPWMNAFNPNWAWGLSGKGLNGVSTDGTTTRQQHADVSLFNGFGFNLGQKRVVEADKDHALESEHELSLKDGKLGWGWGSGGRSLADDGTKLADSRNEKISLSKTGFGLESSAVSTRDTVTTSRSSGASFDDGKWNASYSGGRSFKLDDDHQLSSSTKASLGSDGASFSRSNESRIKDVELGTVEGEKKSTSLGWGKDGLTAGRSQSQTTEIDGQKFTNGSSTSYSGGNLTHARERSQTTTDANGQKQTESSSKSASIGRDGLGYSVSNTDAGGNKTAANVTAKAGLDSSGNLNNLQMGAGVSRNNKSVSVHAGYSVESGEPVQQGDGWVVEWSRKLSAGGKAGGSKGPVKVGGGATYNDTEFGTRRFKTKDEATAFQKDAAARLPGRAPNTAQEAMNLGIGESQGHSHGLDASVSGGVSLAGGGNIGVGGKHGSSSSLSVHRVSANIFEITDASGSNSGVSGSLGTLGSGATAHSGYDSASSRRLRFDLATPDGQAAFNAYNNDPSQIPSRGTQVVSSTETKGEDSGVTVNLPWHSNDRTSRVEEAVTQDEAGKLERYTGKSSQQISTSLPFFDKTHDNVGVQFDATERNDRDSHYALSGSVDSSSGADSVRHLAALTSSAYRSSEGAKSSGKWGVEVEITDEMVNQFIAEVGSEQVRHTDLFSGADARNELRQQLGAAKTSDDKKRALARFVADDGFDGKAIKQVREVLTGGYANPWSFAGDYESLKRNKNGNLSYDLSLPGDRNFQGMGARLELEGKIKKYQSLIAANPTASGVLHGEIAPLLDEVRRQRNEIADVKRYTDLPDELRETQVARLDGYLETLNGLRVQAGESMIEADAPKPEAATNKGGKTPAPETGPLKALGADIAEWSGNIKSDQTDYEFNKSEFKTLRQRQWHLNLQLDGGPAISKLEAEARKFTESAKKLNPRIDDLRAEYLQLRGDPAQASRALEVGGRLKESLQQQSDLWQDATNGMENAKNRLETMMDEAQEEREHPAPMLNGTPMALDEKPRAKSKRRY